MSLQMSWRRLWKKEDTVITYTEDVMKMMTRIRKDWGLAYPEELN